MMTVIGKAIVPSGKQGTSVDHVAVAKVLLSHGARCNARDVFGKTILHYAIGPLYTMPGRGADILQIAELCLAHAKRINICNPCLVDYRDRFGSVPLFMAIQLNIESLVRLLCIRHHANGTLKDVEDFSPLDASSRLPSIRRIMEKVYFFLRFASHLLHTFICPQICYINKYYYPSPLKTIHPL